MSIETLRGIGTVLALVAFVAIWIWAWSGKRKAGFDAAANLPFADTDAATDTDTGTGADTGAATKPHRSGEPHA